jgi:putative FmdB family regulatory protein
MPTYDTICQCGNKEEVFDSFKNLPLFRCKKCGSNVSIQMSAPCVHFKASAGEVRRAEVVYEDADGTKHTKRLRDIEKQYNTDKKV